MRVTDGQTLAMGLLCDWQEAFVFLIWCSQMVIILWNVTHITKKNHYSNTVMIIWEIETGRLLHYISLQAKYSKQVCSSVVPSDFFSLHNCFLTIPILFMQLFQDQAPIQYHFSLFPTFKICTPHCVMLVTIFLYVRKPVGRDRWH